MAEGTGIWCWVVSQREASLQLMFVQVGSSTCPRHPGQAYTGCADSLQESLLQKRTCGVLVARLVERLLWPPAQQRAHMPLKLLLTHWLCQCPHDVEELLQVMVDHQGQRCVRALALHRDGPELAQQSQKGMYI